MRLIKKLQSSGFFGRYVFSNEYQAVLNRADTLGYTKPSYSIQVQQDIFITAISSIWSKITVLRIFATNDSATGNFSKLNLKDPANNLAVVNGSLTYSYGGWKGDGATGYMDQNYNPTAGGIYTLNSAFQAFYVRQRSETANTALSGQITSTSTQIRNALSTNQRLNSGGDLASPQDLSGIGFKSINRPDSSNLNFYADLTKSDIARTSFTLPNENMILFRFGSVYGDMELSFFACGQALNQSEMNLLRNSFNAYYKAIWQIGVTNTINVYFIAGQSNAAGRAVNSAISPELNGSVGSKIYALLPGPYPGTINRTSNWQTLTLGTNNTTESPSTQHGIEMRLGYSLYQNYNNTGIIKLGVGSTSMNSFWLTGGSGNVLLKKISFDYALQALRDTLRVGIVLRGFVWIQGESDCTGGLGANYGTLYKGMIKNFLDEADNAGIDTSKLRWYTLQTKNGGSAGYDPTDYANVIAGQADAMNNFLTENPTYSTKIKALTYRTTDDIPLLDTQHYSTTGINTLGQILASYFNNYINE